MLDQFYKYAFLGKLLRQSAKGPIERNLDRLGKAGLVAIPVAAGVSTAKKSQRGFDPDVNAAHFGIQRVE